MWVIYFPSLWCWFQFSDGAFSTLGCSYWGPGTSLKVIISQVSEAGPMFCLPRPVVPAFAHPCSLVNLTLGPWPISVTFTLSGTQGSAPSLPGDQ